MGVRMCSGVPRGVRGVRTAPGDTLRGVTPELVFSVKNPNFFLNWKTEVLMRTTNISKNDNLLKTRTVQIYVTASQPRSIQSISLQRRINKRAVNKFIHSLAKHHS